jgi:hypothetical protein
VNDATRRFGRSLAPPLLGAAAGFVAGVALYAVSFDPSCCICDPEMAIRWFPHAILLVYDADKTLPFTSPVTWLQWPTYGMVLGTAWAACRTRGRLVAALLVLVLAALLALQHLAAARAADAWVQSFPYEPG